MHKKRLSLNTFSALLLEFVTVACGLILPRLIIRSYGSEVNGLVNSIRQFLAAISFLEFGIGAVVQSTLYKPLAENDRQGINIVISSAGKFFRNIGIILGIYVCVLIIGYPTFSNGTFSRSYIAFLILALSISSFSQYFIGCVDNLLLMSDQRGYIQYFASIVTTVLNTVACAILIRRGFGIHAVQFVTGLLYLLRPMVVRIYIKKHYSIDYHAKYTGEPIVQKWNAVAQHVAYMILESTDIIVLTLFSTLSAVSIYSVYFLVVRGIKQLFISVSGGFQALFGELYAKEDFEGLHRAFGLMEWLYGTMTTIVYGCAAFLIVPFVSVYTLNVQDANYNQPLFAIILLSAFWIYCNNLPYHSAILAAGHYRQTQKYFIIAAVINIIISIATVRMFGLIGVAIGTMAAMLFQTIWMVLYNIRNISKRPAGLILKQFGVDSLIILVSSILSTFIRFSKVSWLAWVVMGVKITIIWGVVSLIASLIFYRKWVFLIISKERKAA